MEFSVMRKKLNSYKLSNGTFRNLSGEMLIEILRTWENYSGPFAKFSRDIGVRKSQLGPIIHKARRLAKDSEYQGGKFKEVKVSSDNVTSFPLHGKIELVLDGSKVIRFEEVDLLIDFLKKSAA